MDQRYVCDCLKIADVRMKILKNTKIIDNQIDI
jgi:hypothetical protein